VPAVRRRDGQVHGYCERTVADVPADGRPVVVRVRVRRMRCPDPGCPVQTFREQVPGVLDCYQRRTTRLAGQAGEVARRLAGRAGAGLLTALGVPVSRDTAPAGYCCGSRCPRSASPACWALATSRCAAGPRLRDRADRCRDRGANGRTEGVNTKTKMIKRQMCGRAGFALLPVN